MTVGQDYVEWVNKGNPPSGKDYDFERVKKIDNIVKAEKERMIKAFINKHSDGSGHGYFNFWTIENLIKDLLES